MNASTATAAPDSTANRIGATASSSRFSSLRQFQDTAHQQFEDLRVKLSVTKTTGGGQYSISKLGAFEAYKNSTRLKRSVAVLLLTPLPCIAVVLFLESIPLANPLLGWQSNSTYFLRMWLGTFATSVAVACEIEEFIPEIQLSWVKLSVIGCSQALAFIGIIMCIAVASGVFPVPFSLLIPVAPMMLVGAVTHYMLAREKIARTTNFLPRFKHVMEIIQLESVPLMLYPVYATVFMQLPPKQQFWFSIALPILKFICRFLVWKKMQCDDMDSVGVISAASSQLFHILFITTCVQNAKSSSTLGLVVAWNVMQALVHCISMVQTSKKMNWLQQTVDAGPGIADSPDIIAAPEPCLAQTTLSTRVLALVNHQETVSRLFQLDQRVLLSSCYHYHDRKWTAVHQQLLQIYLLSQGTVGAMPNTSFSDCHNHANGQAGGVHRHHRNSSLADHLGCKMQSVSTVFRSVAIGASSSHSDFLSSAPMVSRQHQGPSSGNQAAASVAIHVAEVQDAIAALHTTEVILLRCYISIIGYVLYGVYLLGVYLFSNSEYIVKLMRVSSVHELYQVMAKLGILSAIEVLILGAYLVTIQKVFGVAGIKQLAFALSSQRRTVQAKLIMWGVIIFSFPLAHSGNDVTFRFEWICNSRQ